MHRQRTRLAARVNRVAKTFEFRGIIATYKLHDRLLTNQAARRRFQRSTPGLDEVQRRVLESLKTDGYALLPFSELVPDTSNLWLTFRESDVSRRTWRLVYLPASVESRFALNSVPAFHCGISFSFATT